MQRKGVKTYFKGSKDSPRNATLSNLHAFISLPLGKEVRSFPASCPVFPSNLPFFVFDKSRLLSLVLLIPAIAVMPCKTNIVSNT